MYIFISVWNSDVDVNVFRVRVIFYFLLRIIVPINYVFVVTYFQRGCI